MTPSVAFVTKSYGPDLERCELLCRSVELLAPDTSHWIIVDSRDRSAFRGLENARTRIVTTEELLPRRVRKFEVYGTDKNFWLGARTPPIRGWLVQQLAKFAIALVAREDVLIHADSDIVLIRPFREELLMDETERFGCSESRQRSARDFRTTCAGIGRLSDFWGFRLVHYRCPTTSAAWFRGVGKSRSHCCRRSRRGPAVTGCGLSQVRGTSPSTSSTGASSKTRSADRKGQPGDSLSLCRCYWGSEPLTNRELESFIDEAAPDEVAVMVSAKAGMRPADYADVFERRWAAPAKSES